MRLRMDKLNKSALRSALNHDIGEIESIARSVVDFATMEVADEEPERIDFGSLVYSIADAYGSATFESGPPKSRSMICAARPVALRRCITNLLDNAIAYGKKVRISFSQSDDDEIVLTMLDEGPGIPQEQLDAVFRPFIRVDKSRNRRTGGFGLGLTIARNIARSLGGEIRLVQQSRRRAEDRAAIAAGAGASSRADGGVVARHGHVLHQRHGTEMTLVVLIGASGSGKTTIAEAIAAQRPQDLDVFHFDRIGVPAVERMIADYGSPAGWQRAKTFDWMFRLAGTVDPGRDVLFEGQMRLAFLSAAIAASGLTDCIPVLVDCDDETRRRRLSLDRMQPELADQSMMDWARFLRDEATSAGCEILDTSALSLAASVEAVSRHFV